VAGGSTILVRLISSITFADPMRSSFLEDMEQIAVRSYQVTDDDIMRGRLRRSGIKEYSMVFENGKPPSP